jgi:hypothetical protein
MSRAHAGKDEKQTLEALPFQASAFKKASPIRARALQAVLSCSPGWFATKTSCGRSPHPIEQKQSWCKAESLLLSDFFLQGKVTQKTFPNSLGALILL